MYWSVYVFIFRGLAWEFYSDKVKEVERLSKEPLSVSRFLQNVPDVARVSAEDVETSLLSMLQAAPGEDLDKQSKQLNRQGVARFLGSASTCRLWGIIRPTQASQKPLKRKAVALDDKPNKKTRAMLSSGLVGQRRRPLNQLRAKARTCHSD